MTSLWKARLLVKTGADADRLKVDRQAVTVRYLRTRPKPSFYPQDRRIRPTELHTFPINKVRLVAFKEEDDSDYHLIIKDSAGRSMITEIPAPGPQRIGTHQARTTPE